MTILYFAAAAIGCVTGRRPAVGYICFGQQPIHKTLRLRRPQHHRAVLQEILNARTAEPPVELNAHCPTCQYRGRRRNTAIAADSLSLVTSIPPKERRKLQAKGITTITQLSYTYRPRRLRRAHATPRSTPPLVSKKNDHRLKALAIRKDQVHILSADPTTREGTPVYFDVEGIPSADIYYLTGLRFKMGNEWVEHSYWADSRAEERDIWRQCLATLLVMDRPYLVHYGSYESNYISRMRQRYRVTKKANKQLDEIGSWNLLKDIYGSIYFPTFTNGLKDVAGYLGFKWSDATLTGSLAHLLRLQWELAPSEATKQILIRYNMEDCRAAQLVAEAIDGYQREAAQGSILTPNLVDIDTLRVPYQRSYGPFASASSDFHRINSAAYWNYQRERVFVRTDRRLAPKKVSRSRSPQKRPPPPPDKVLYIERQRPTRCPKCRRRRFSKAGCQTQTVIDLVFTRKGARRQIARQNIQRYRCVACREEMGVPRQRTRVGARLQAYIIYLMMEMRLSNAQISKNLKDLFGIAMTATTVHEVKRLAAEQLQPLYRQILDTISNGPLVHVDETKGVVPGGGHYVWVFANMTTVAYVYSPGRDQQVLTEVLEGFHGVLVSDFYGVYDSMECAQQRCLIHLMRDINEAMRKSAFNEQISSVAAGFGNLLREIVDTVDRRGLKSRYLRKHKRDVRRFFQELKMAKLTDDTAVAIRRRFVKNEGKLFTFLDHDNVPWNNNNAEHAVRAFTKLRNMMATSTAKGTREYAVLLSVQQTLKYRNMDLLKFLLSPERQIEGLG
jgi:predicted RecB family nuclease